MATVVETGFGPIILAIKSRLVTELSLASAQVKIVSRDRRSVPAFTGDKDILLRPTNFVVDQEAYHAAGRHATAVKRWLDVFCRARNYLDEVQEDESFLTDTANDVGFLDWEEDVARTLCGFFPIDASGNHLTSQEMRLYDGEMPNKDQLMLEWGDSSIRFEIKYLMLLGQENL